MNSKFEKLILMVYGLFMSPIVFAHGIGPVFLFVFIIFGWYLVLLILLIWLIWYFIASKASWKNKGIVCLSLLFGVALSFLLVVLLFESSVYFLPGGMGWQVTLQGLAVIILAITPVLGAYREQILQK
jgi:hypothetical protein